jgi:UDP-N-acetylmuramoyl-tripeptide--D-alanyl-D-alanine ligase
MTLGFRWADLPAITAGRLSGGDASSTVGPVAVDSQAVSRGGTFVALPGQRRDGHDFVRPAVERGATGVVVSRDVGVLPAGVACLRVDDTLRALQEVGAAHRKLFTPAVVGVTGSNGKTTTKEMVARVLRASGREVLATRGNLNSQVGLPLMLMELEAGHGYAVFEMGASKRGEIARLAELARPRIGVLTNVGPAHLETFGTLQDVFEAKWELAASLPRDGLAVLNADDPFLAARRTAPACPVMTFGLGPKADVRAENIVQEPGASFDLVLGGVRRRVRLAAPGAFNVLNALAAAAVGLHERVPLDELVAALERAVPPPGRMQVRVSREGAVMVLDAYNANPASMSAAVESFVRAYADRKRLAVLGGMRELGAAAEAEHAGVGERLAGLSLDRIFFLGEEGDWVRAGYEKGGGAARFEVYASRDELREALRRELGPGVAAVFKASRGVRLEEVYEPLLAALPEAGSEKGG